jgi:hypothetical protein
VSPYDPKRELEDLYAPKNRSWELVDVPEQQFLAIDGAGDPNTSPAYAHAVAALFAVAYTIKFAAKRGGSRDFVVGPLEGLWWADTPAAFTARAKDTWHWTLLISQPDWITPDIIDDAKRSALAKKKLPSIADLYRKNLNEARCAQVLHIGSYDEETPILAELHETYLPAQNLRERDAHHEIYLGDPRKTDAAKLKTVLRQPVR